MSGTAASCDPTHDPHLREASWLDLPRDREDIASVGPPVWRWTVPLTTAGVEIDAYLGSFDEQRDTQDGARAADCEIWVRSEDAWGAAVSALDAEG